jgi:hypothetical protein
MHIKHLAAWFSVVGKTEMSKYYSAHLPHLLVWAYGEKHLEITQCPEEGSVTAELWTFKLHSLWFLIVFLFFLFWWYKIWTQGLAFARQVLYHLSHSASPLWFLFSCNKISLRSKPEQQWVLCMRGINLWSQQSWLLFLSQGPLQSSGRLFPSTPVPSTKHRALCSGFCSLLAQNCSPGKLGEL